MYLDFLVEHTPRTSGSAEVEGVVASIIPGVNRALATARIIEVTGVGLHEAEQKLTARVCEIGPFLALKLRAFCDRQQPKDAFDILYALRHYDRGTTAAVTAFAEEVRVGNPACPDALRSLKEHFIHTLSGAQFGAHRLAQSQVLIDLAIGNFTALAQKHGSMFRALDFPNKGVFSTTRTCAEFYSESRSGFGDRSM